MNKVKGLSQSIKIIALSFFITISILSIATSIYRKDLYEWQRNVQMHTSREIDGSENLILLNKESDALGLSGVKFIFNDDGSIHIYGKARVGISKEIAWIELLPGKYELNGIPDGSAGGCLLTNSL